ncbi:MAG: sodium:calcium antiporter, partial [Bacteroidaceae bacterium]|nr:sodium:calcium antiporter [Bacteroidaceae bacterium]
MEYLILIASLAGIVFGADYLVSGAVSLARRYRVSDFVIGAAIVGVGTSMPELVVSFMGAVNGNADVAIGNVVGSNIFNVLGILGLTALFFPVAIEKKNMKFEIPLCIAVSVLLMILALNFFDGTAATIGRADGWILLLSFVGFMWYSFARDRKDGNESTEQITDAISPLWLAIVKVVGGLALLIVSCDFFVDNAVLIIGGVLCQQCSGTFPGILQSSKAAQNLYHILECGVSLSNGQVLVLMLEEGSIVSCSFHLSGKLNSLFLQLLVLSNQLGCILQGCSHV